MKKLTPALFAAALALLPAVSQAGGIPVFDGTNVIQNTLTALRTLQQYEQMIESYKTQIEELEQATQQVESLTGSRGIGDLLNSRAFRDARRYTPSSWRDTLRILEAGGLPGSASDVRDIYAGMSDRYGIAGAAETNTVNAEAPNAQAFEQRRDTNFATAAVSEASYDRTSGRMQNYESLMGAIENAPDMKAIGDLTARINAENGTALAELIRLNAVQMQHMAAQENQRLVDETNMRKLTRFQAYRIEDIPAQ